MGFIDDLNWRYATKQFNPTKTVSTEDLATLKEAIRLSVSSFGLQLYKIVIVKDKETKQKLFEHSWNQSQIINASHLFVFCNQVEVTENDVRLHIQRIAETRKIPVESIEGYQNLIQQFITEMPVESKKTWMEKQTYIAMTNLVNAAAMLKIDACPMEGFVPEKYDEILGLTERGLNSVLVVPVGYRNKEDKYQYLTKVRKSIDELFEEV